MTDTNTITVEDLAGLDALPIGTEFKSHADSFRMEFRRTESGVELQSSSGDTEWTTGFIARKYLPVEITNPETLGGFAGIGDRVRIEATDPDSWGADYTGRFGILRQINPGLPETVPFRVELEEPDFYGNKTAWCTSVKPAPQPFKVGDRVRVVREYQNSYDGGHLDGAIATLESYRDDDLFPYRIELDGGQGFDVVHEIEAYDEPAVPETPVSHPVVLDQAGLNALGDDSVIVGIGSNFSRSPLAKRNGQWMKPGFGGTYNLLAADLLGDAGVFVVHQG